MSNTRNPFTTVIYNVKTGVPEKIENGVKIYEFSENNVLLTQQKYKAGWKKTDQTKAILKSENGGIREIRITNIRDGNTQSDTCKATYKQFILETDKEFNDEEILKIEDEIWKYAMNKLGCEYYSLYDDSIHQ